MARTRFSSVGPRRKRPGEFRAAVDRIYGHDPAGHYHRGPLVDGQSAGELGGSAHPKRVGKTRCQSGPVIEPDYAVLGETDSYNYEAITKAVRLIEAGAQFIATNPDPAGPTEAGTVPGCGAMAALIEKATGKPPFFVGKPNPLMMRTALNYIDVHSEDTVMVGDRMDTDIVAGVESGMRTILVLSGVTTRIDVEKFPYRPTWILKSVAEIEV